MPAKVRKPANGLRTSSQTFDTTGDQIDFSFLSPGEDVVSIAVRATSGTALLQGASVDDWITVPAGGVTLDVDFDTVNNTARLPSIKGSGGSVTVDILVDIYTK